MAGREDMHAEALPKYEANSTKQGVLHLSPSELTFIVSLLERIVEEQKADAPNSALLKQKYLEVILLEIKKTVNYQNRKYIACSAGNQKIIARILAEMEENLTEPFNITGGCQAVCIQPELSAEAVQGFYRVVANSVYQPPAHDSCLRIYGAFRDEHKGSGRKGRHL